MREGSGQALLNHRYIDLVAIAPTSPPSWSGYCPGATALGSVITRFSSFPFDRGLRLPSVGVRVPQGCQNATLGWNSRTLSALCRPFGPVLMEIQTPATHQNLGLRTNFCSHKLSELFAEFLSIRPAVFPPTLNANFIPKYWNSYRIFGRKDHHYEAEAICRRCIDYSASIDLNHRAITKRAAFIPTGPARTRRCDRGPWWTRSHARNQRLYSQRERQTLCALSKPRRRAAVRYRDL